MTTTRPFLLRNSSCFALTLVLATLGCDDEGRELGFDGWNGQDQDGQHEGADPDGDEPEQGGNQGEDAAAINEYIFGLGTYEPDPEQLQPGDIGEPVPSEEYMCTTQNFLETKQFDKIVAFAANSNNLWPGAIVRGDAVFTGLFAPIALERAPLTFSASLEGVVAGQLSAELENPSLSSFREAMKQILNQELIGQTPANVFSEIHRVHSSEQLSLALGIDVDWLNGGIESSFNFDEEETRSRYVVNFTQTYYTVDVDTPGLPADFFTDDVTLTEVEQGVGDIPPAYVSSVTYGRMVYFAITSEFSAKELESALEFAYNGGAVQVDASVSLTHEEVLEQSSITAHILGGDGTMAVKAIHGIEELTAFLSEGGTYTKESPGAPIAYKLAYMANHSPARMSLTTDYDVTECEKVTQNVRVALDDFTVTNAGNSASLELFGQIWVRDENGVDHILFDKPSSTAVDVPAGGTWPLNGEIQAHKVAVTPKPGHKLELYLNVQEKDGGWFDSDDEFGGHSLALPFEDGWRREVIVPLATGAQQIEVRFQLKPV